jgi:hypothetical protein
MSKTITPTIDSWIDRRSQYDTNKSVYIWIRNSGTQILTYGSDSGKAEIGVNEFIEFWGFPECPICTKFTFDYSRFVEGVDTILVEIRNSKIDEK